MKGIPSFVVIQNVGIERNRNKSSDKLFVSAAVANVGVVGVSREETKRPEHAVSKIDRRLTSSTTPWANFLDCRDCCFGAGFAILVGVAQKETVDSIRNDKRRTILRRQEHMLSFTC